MHILTNFIYDTNNIKKDTLFWNSIATFLNSFQTMLLLLIITHIGSSNDSSIFVMAYSVGNLLYNFSKFGVRQFQVTDINEKYLYSDYLNARIISSFFMITSIIIYISYNNYYIGYSNKKNIVVILICMYKGIEAFEDVFHGRMQQKGRLDVAGKIWSIRLLSFIITYAIIYILSKDLILASLISVILSFIQCIYLNLSVLRYFSDKKFVLSSLFYNTKWKKIIIECFPLFVSSLLNMYIGNAPKYVIDEKVSDSVQTEFNIVFMPVFVVSLFSNFIFQPSLIKIGILWQNKKIADMNKIIKKLFLIPLAIDFFCTVTASILGIPFLSAIYNVDLSDYRIILIIFMLAGGTIAIMNLFIMVLTTMRQQKLLFIGYFISSGMILLFGDNVLYTNGLLGLSLYYLFILLTMNIYFGLIYHYTIKKFKVQKI